MASSANCKRKFSRGYFLSPGMFKSIQRPRFLAHRAALMTKTVSTFPAFSSTFVDFAIQFRFHCKFFTLVRSDAWVKFDSGVIFLNCFILYRQQITSRGRFSCWLKWAKAGFRIIVKDSEIKSFICSSLLLYYIKQIYSMLPCVCSVIDHRRRQNVVRTSVTHSAIASCATCTCVL